MKSQPYFLRGGDGGGRVHSSGTGVRFPKQGSKSDYALGLRSKESGGLVPWKTVGKRNSK